MIYSLLEKFIKPKVLAVNKYVFKMMKLDLNANRMHYKNVKIGIATTSLLNKLKASEGAKIQFTRCLDFFVGVVHKLQERCPLKYKLTRAVSSLNLNLIYSNTQLAKKQMTELLTIHHEAKLIGVSTLDPADSQFQELCILATGAPEFKNFDFYKERMDDFYVTILGEKPKFKELFNVVRLVCILSHGNATAESGFSTNSDVFVENLLEKSVVAQRQVYDGIHHSKGVLKVDITKSLIKSVNISHSTYQEALKESRKKCSEAENRNTEKRLAQMKIKALKAMKAKLNESVQHDLRQMDEEMKLLKRKLNDG